MSSSLMHGAGSEPALVALSLPEEAKLESDACDEVVEERTFLLGNRFAIKCHREKAGFACVLCYRYRDRDTICESINGLVKHIWQKHDIAEYESDKDIREVSMVEERTSTKY